MQLRWDQMENQTSMPEHCDPVWVRSHYTPPPPPPLTHLPLKGAKLQADPNLQELPSCTRIKVLSVQGARTVRSDNFPAEYYTWSSNRQQLYESQQMKRYGDLSGDGSLQLQLESVQRNDMRYPLPHNLFIIFETKTV